MRLLLLLLRRGGVPRRAYATLTPADMLRIQATRGANLELDPRGVDYDLFETPSLEYTHQQREAPAVSDIPAPILTMQRACCVLATLRLRRASLSSSRSLARTSISH